MRLPLVAATSAFVAGALVWGSAAVQEYGAVSGESRDPSQTARIVEPVPARTGAAKVVGLVLMVGAAVGAVTVRAIRK